MKRLMIAIAVALVSPALLPQATARAGCSIPSAIDACGFAERTNAADSYLATRPGTIGYVLRDRETGAVYQNSHANDPVWTASTIKLAMVVDLLRREETGSLGLNDGDHGLMTAMLRNSDNAAADALWARYGGAGQPAYNANFPSYGMTDVPRPQRFTNTNPVWGEQKVTPSDLDRLINYALTGLAAADSAYIVDELQHVAPNQQWGVWGAGPDMAPGNKNGWTPTRSGWVVNTVGFAGPGQRYTLAVMNSLGANGGYAEGVSTTTHLSELLLSGL